MTPSDTKSVSAHFPRAVSVYDGTEVRILGVRVGEVTAVIPEGNSVRVEMEYDAKYDVPEDAQAVIVTPTLVADRFVQLTPVYESGPAMADGAEIALPDTGVPVELDRIYAGLQTLTVALGPNGVNADGTLDHFLKAARNAFEGQGEEGNEMLRELSAAVETFGEGAGPLFETVTSLAEFTTKLADNDKLVRAFMRDLAGVSQTLAAESDELQAAVAAVADAVGSVEGFVRNNRDGLVKNVRSLTTVMAVDRLREGQPRQGAPDRAAGDGQPEDELRPLQRQPELPHRHRRQHLDRGRAGLRHRPADPRDAAGPQGHRVRPDGPADPAAHHEAAVHPAGVQALHPRGHQEGAEEARDARRLLRRERRSLDDEPARRHVMRRWVRWAAAVAAGAVLLSGCDFDGAYDLPLPGHPVDKDESFEITVDFADVLNVVPRSPVMVDDVVVGEVTEVERIGWHARVQLRIKDNIVLPDNAIAEIRQVSLLGEKYVALEPPTDEESDGRLGEGDTIDLAATGRNPEVEEVLGALSFLLSGGGVAQLGTITREANMVMSGREDRLRSMLGSLEGVVGTLDKQKTDIIHAMESLNNLASTLNEEKDTIGDALDAVGPAIEVLSDQHDELIGMLSSLDRLGEVGTRVINASKEDVLSMLDDLAPILNGLQGRRPQAGAGAQPAGELPVPEGRQLDRPGRLRRHDRARGDRLREPLQRPSGCPTSSSPTRARSSTRSRRCLRSGSMTSAACRKVLDSVNLLKDLKKQCKQKANRDNIVCQIVNAVPTSAS